MRRSYREFWFLPESVLQEILLTGQKFQLSTSNGSTFYIIFVQGCSTSPPACTLKMLILLVKIGLPWEIYRYVAKYFKFIYCLQFVSVLISASYFHPLDY